MALRHLFTASTSSNPTGSADQAETDTVRRIVQALQQVDPARRRYLAGFAYVLARAAHADLEITDAEARVMEHVVAEIGGVPEAQAVLVVEIARNQAELYSGTEDYLVTREFNKTATDEERRAAVAACFAVAASDDEITSDEYSELTEIAEELGLSRPELNMIRNEYRDKIVALRQMRQRLAEGQPGEL
jgi:tellurite resistance protein